MLYRTRHHPFLLSHSPFTSISLPPSPPSSLISSTLSLQVVGQGMGPVAKPALKESLRPSGLAAFRTTPFNHQQTAAVFDDLTAVNGSQTAVLGDDFFVDDLLDFSNVVTEDTTEEVKNQEAFEKNETDNVKTTASDVTSVTMSINLTNFESLPSSELAVPGDDLESLEWLSQFVDDSFSEYSLTCPPVKQLPPPEPNFKAQSGPELAAAVQKRPTFAASFQTKARTKRARTGGRVWSLASPSPTESSAASSSSSSSSTNSSCSPWAGYSSFISPAQMAESLLGKPLVKKQKKPTPESSAAPGGGMGGQQGRRCSHCGVQKTPQWRAGPLGAKTLCNACGVRFKSGRLLPEYRPACSPTFSSELHSNNHRKVLEMRQKKELEADMAPPVQSF